MIRLRDAGPGDAPAIAAIWNPIIRDTAITFWPQQRSESEIAAIIHDRRKAGHPFLLSLSDEGDVTGFASYSQFRAGGGYARSMEHSINLHPQARGSGSAKLLLDALEDHARAAGHRLMIGGITASNVISIRFHDRMGYSEWGRIPAAGWKFGQFHDLVFMGKDLTI
ncbi:GNAT family N-acetyltransferase [Paracoccus onubensis]|uniref:GNAT family N-acetyltransferase n=1 Tax=Paracoccus onubensis TaxID=1675788 RepID=UPI001603F09F|nr:GNAT family N-acetyltransferase [Paracoccus onubensis]